MRSYCSIYVDAGYLLASSATRVTGTSLRRGVQVDHPALIQGLISQAEEHSGMPLLRVNWYDSGGRPGGGPDIHQDLIGMLPRVKLRLGRLSQTGEQKGVDLRMGLDMATYARNRVVDIIYLVSGDDDLTEAVEEAQFHGLQVMILAVPDHRGRPHAVAKNLQREADGVMLIDAAVVDDAVKSLAIDPALIPAREEETAAGPADGAAGAVPEVGSAEAPGEAAAGLEPAAPVAGSASEMPETIDRPAVPPIPGPRPGPGPSAPDKDAQPTGPAAPAAGADQHPANREMVEQGSDGIPPAPSAPKPSVLAGKRPTTIVPPKIPTTQTPMWSTSTGDPGRGEDSDGITVELIDAVVRQVLVSWTASATPAMLIDLRKGEPFIPGDLDRTLLLDLSSRSGIYDIDDIARHELRDRFWMHVKRLKMT